MHARHLRFSGAQAFTDEQLRDVIARNGLGILRTPNGGSWYNDIQGTTTAALNELNVLATLTGHSDLKYSCVLPTGLSSAGWDATAWMLAQPARTIAAFPVAGGDRSTATNAAARLIPMGPVNQGNDGFYP